ncbi:hypothetical protein C8R43DRAFT_961076 [Mycena crocata]|nr:hypothetical protein C8R43DRAFT_961076 [Mycena crocata]
MDDSEGDSVMDDCDCETENETETESETDSAATDYNSSDSDTEMSAEWPSSERTISDIDRDYEADGQCDICNIPLGPHIDPDKRAFRCCHCELSIQCESCCSEAHLGQSRHILQEWDSKASAWGQREMLNDAEFAFRLVKNCGSCCVEIGPSYSTMPEGTIWGFGWEESTLRAEGLVHQLGHGGRVCLSPEEPSRPMLIIDATGCQTVQLKFCGCGKYEQDVNGDWQQIFDNGWHQSSLVHPAAFNWGSRFGTRMTKPNSFCLLHIFFSNYLKSTLPMNVNGASKVSEDDKPVENKNDAPILASKDVKTINIDGEGTELLSGPVGQAAQRRECDEEIKKKEFNRLMREARHMALFKRSGRMSYSLEDAGIFKPGNLAVFCRACPEPDLLMPERWNEAPH